MMCEVIRIAQVMGEMEHGGVEAVIMNYYRHIDRSKFQFDFFAIDYSSIPQRKEIEALGGRIYLIPSYKQLGKYISTLEKYFKKNKYRIVHANVNTLNVFPLYAAKKAGVPIRISHNHSTAGKGEIKKNIMKYMLRPFAKVYATHYVACSKHAGRWLYGEGFFDTGKVTILNNAIDFKYFKFDYDARNKLRQELGIDNYIVIGHIGRFMPQKNHHFLVDIFNEVHKINSKTALLLVGDGELHADIEKKVFELKLYEYVKFINAKSDVAKYYQAMDRFCFPSLYEGLGMVAIEAQACNLPVIASANVPKDIKITPNVEFISLDKSPKFWAERILKSKSMDRRKAQTDFSKCPFNIEVECKKLENYYEDCFRQSSDYYI